MLYWYNYNITIISILIRLRSKNLKEIQHKSDDLLYLGFK